MVSERGSFFRLQTLMKNSLLGKHYRELINLRRITINIIKGIEQYRKDILQILSNLKRLENSRSTQYPLGEALAVDISNFKLEILLDLSQNTQQLEQFYFEKEAIDYNLSRLPLG